jgi:membrane protease YdiL (CAAX protease family)
VATAAQPWHAKWRDYYALLGVPRGASPSDIRRAFEERARRIEPAASREAPAGVRQRAEDEFALLNQALRVLGDEWLRRLYDEEFDRLASFRSGAMPAAGAPAIAEIAPSPEHVPPAAAGAAAVEAPPPTPVAERGERPWGLGEALAGSALAIGAFLVIGTAIVGGTMAATGRDEGTPIIVAGLVATMVFDVVLVGIVYMLTVRKFHLSWQALGFRSVSGYVWLPPVAAFCLLAANGLYTLLVRALGADALAPDQELGDLFDARAVLPLTGVFTILVAPLAEETFFRGFLFPALIGRLRWWGAALVSGIAFGAVHITSVDTLGLIIPVGFIGVCLALLYHRTGSLWITIATHLTINTVSFAVLASAAGGSS